MKHKWPSGSLLKLMLNTRGLILPFCLVDLDVFQNIYMYFLIIDISTDV